MISTEDLTLGFGGRILFENVDIEVHAGQLLRLDRRQRRGQVDVPEDLVRARSSPTPARSRSRRAPHQHPCARITSLSTKCTALPAVIMGHKRLYALMHEKDELYAKPDFSEADGLRAAELEAEFARSGRLGRRSRARRSCLSELAISGRAPDALVKELSRRRKGPRAAGAGAVRQSGHPAAGRAHQPPGRRLDPVAGGVSARLPEHRDRRLPRSPLPRSSVCTHIADIDFRKIPLYTGNYTFWYETSQLALRQQQESNREEGRPDQGAEGVHPALQRQRLEVAAGHVAQEAARQDHARRHQAVVAQVPVHRVQAASAQSARTCCRSRA